jgi:hypothetical protein
MDRRIAYPEFSHLTEYGECEFLYALEISDCTVKIGRTDAPRQRMRDHTRALRPRGLRIVRFEMVPIDGSGDMAERDLIRRLKRMAVRQRGLEWFSGLKWGAAVTLLKQESQRQCVDLPHWHVTESAFFRRELAVKAKAG